MPIVPLTAPQKQEQHDRPKPQRYTTKKSYAGVTIHSAKRENAISLKINKYIELVMIPERHSAGMENANVGIILNDAAISKILSQRYETVRVSIINTEDDLKKLIAKKPDLVFSGTEYFDLYDEETKQHKGIWFSDYLAEHNIAYIGSSSDIYQNAYDKVRAKEIMLAAGINTAQFFTTTPDELTLEQSLQIDFPVFVKPDRGGESAGVDENSLVTDFEGLKAKVLNIYQNEQSRSLVEKYLPGKEYTVGVFEDFTDGKLTAMPVEIIPGKNKNGDRVLDFDTKKNNAERVRKVRNLQAHASVSYLAIQVFKALKATSHGRIDIKMDEHGTPYFIEANLIPGLGQGYLCKCCSFNNKMSYEQMIYKIADNALAQLPSNA